MSIYDPWIQRSRGAAVFAFVAMWIPAFGNCPPYHEKEFSMLFQKAVSAKGEAYRCLRDQLLKEYVPESIAQNRGDLAWEPSLLHAILALWKRDPQQCKLAQQIAIGKAPLLHPHEFAGGSAPESERLQALNEMGAMTAPALLEHMYKSTDERTTLSFDVCITILRQWKDTRLEPVLQSIFLDTLSERFEFRASSMQALLRIDPSKYLDDCLKVYGNRAESEDMRAFALRGMGQSKNPKAFPKLIEVVRDDSVSLKLRSAAALGMGETNNAALIPHLTDVFQRSKDKKLKESIVDALGVSNNKNAEAPLRNWKADKENVFLLEKIDFALWRLSLVR